MGGALCGDLYRVVSGYVFGNFPISVAAGTVTYLTLIILGIPFAALLGVLGVLLVIPVAAILQVLAADIWPEIQKRRDATRGSREPVTESA